MKGTYLHGGKINEIIYELTDQTYLNNKSKLTSLCSWSWIKQFELDMKPVKPTGRGGTYFYYYVRVNYH